jgi:hypothetical protein
MSTNIVGAKAIVATMLRMQDYIAETFTDSQKALEAFH